MSTPKFVENHNLVAFLEKPTESEGFEQIIDFLNAIYVKYVLMVNSTAYTSCIEQFWATTKVKNVNGEAHIQALVDKKKVIITEASIRKDLRFEDKGGVDCLSNEVIFEQLTLMDSTMASTIICLVINKKFNFSKYIFDNMTQYKFVISADTKKLFANMKREGKGFSEVVTPLFETMMVQAPEDMVPSPSSEIPNEEGVPTTSNDPLPSGQDRVKLNELMILCTNLQKQALDLEKAKTVQAKEIASLKKRVKKLEQKRNLRTLRLKILRKVGTARRVESLTEASWGDQGSSIQGRKINDIDQDTEITLVDETQGRMNVEEMFGINDLDGDEVIMDATAGEDVEQSAKVAENKVSTADPVTTAGVEVTTAATTLQIYKDEVTLA
nr:hypothetical protein [Tanacetum cinerariifolium]